MLREARRDELERVLFLIADDRIGARREKTDDLAPYVAAFDAIAADPNNKLLVWDEDGIVIGRTNLPIVNRGDALFHIARVKDPETSRARIGRIGGELAQAPLFDEDEII